MKNIRKYSIILSLLLLFSGCQHKSNAVVSGNIIKAIKPQQDTVNNTVLNTNTDEMVNNLDGLLLINIVLPKNWKLDKSEKAEYSFIDEKGENKGTVNAITYMDNFDFLTQMPNHSSVTKDEYINIPLGRCRLITLDADNGTAASGNYGNT